MAEKKKPVLEWLPQVVAWVRSLITQSDHAQNNSAAPDYIKNRTHYVENVSTSSVWNQTGCSVGSGTASPGGYPTTFNITTGNKYNVTISQGSNSKTYEGLTAAYDSVFNGLALRKNWSDSMGMSDTSTDALLLVVQPSNVVLRSADIYGENCTVQVSEVTETIHKLDRKYLPALNEIDHISSSKSGSVTTVTITETEGATTSFQISDGANGTNGTNGTDGKSAYQVAVDNGYSGTEAQWLASLKGADGVSLGEVELVQQLSQDDDKVPSAKAVQDGIEVWRDDNLPKPIFVYSNIQCGTATSQVIDTGWHPFNCGYDWAVIAQVSDLDLTTGTLNNTVFSNMKQVGSTWVGMGFCRKNDTTRIKFWLAGNDKQTSTAHTGEGSINIFIVKKEGDAITYMLNGQSYTYTVTTDQSASDTLHIGNTSLSCKVDSIIACHIEDFPSFEKEGLNIQLYSDYTKSLKIYPKTTIENVKGLPSQLNNISFGAGWSTPASTLYFKLSPAQVGKLNQTDGITIFTSAKTSGVYNYRYAKFFEARKNASNNYNTVDTNGLRVTFNYNNTPIVNGVTFTNGLSYMNIAIEVNKRLGRVRIWNEGYMVEERFNDAFKTDYFVDNDGVFTFSRGEYDQIWYNYQLYSGEIITDWKRTDPFKVIGASTPAKTFMDGFARENFSDPYVFGASPGLGATIRYYRNLGGSTITKAPDSSYADFVNSGAATNELGGANMNFNCLTISITPFDVNEGTFKALKDTPDGNGTKQGSAYVYYRNQDGTQGEEIEDYDSIGQGQYLFVGNSFGSYTSPFLRQVTYPSSIRVYPKTFIFPGCLLDVRMDILYNNRFKDYVSNEDFIMYSNNTLTTEFVPDITTEKADALLDTNFSLSKFPGRMSMHDNNVYMLVHNPTTGAYTWKQLNNS